MSVATRIATPPAAARPGSVPSHDPVAALALRGREHLAAPAHDHALVHGAPAVLRGEEQPGPIGVERALGAHDLAREEGELHRCP